jgi:hypothetical protein
MEFAAIAGESVASQKFGSEEFLALTTHIRILSRKSL